MQVLKNISYRAKTYFMSKQKNGIFRGLLNPSKSGFHILMAILVTAVIFILVILFLRLFTRHGHEIEMPSYAGRSAEELTQQGTPEDFVFVVNDELYENGATPGTVLKQNPLPGEKVKRGRKVYLTVAAAEPPTIKMLELKDLPLRQAQIMLESQGLVLEKVLEEPSPYENVVLKVFYKGHLIPQGTPIKQGEKITLVVGKNIGYLPEQDSTGTSENPL